MRKKYDKLREQYPEYISLEQFRLICRIAKRSATYLIQNGIVPAKDTGGKTWRYQIAIDDVIHYLRRREQWGSMIPPGAVSSPSPKKYRTSFSTMIEAGEEGTVYNYFEQLYADTNDIFMLPEIIILTGLSDNTVLRMLKKGELKSIVSSPRYIVPKQYLLEFVSSGSYIGLKSNSKAFQKIIAGFEVWKATGRLDYNPAASLKSN